MTLFTTNQSINIDMVTNRINLKNVSVADFYLLCFKLLNEGVI